LAIIFEAVTLVILIILAARLCGFKW